MCKAMGGKSGKGAGFCIGRASVRKLYATMNFIHPNLLAISVEPKAHSS